jgi:hypothetical protein
MWKSMHENSENRGENEENDMDKKYFCKDIAWKT